MSDLELILTQKDGYWKYKGGRYLALLASGKISDTFCNLGVITTSPIALRMFATELARSLHGTKLHFPLAVVGPGMGGITLAYQLAQALFNTRGNPVKAFFTEPDAKIEYKKVINTGDQGPVLDPTIVKGQAFRFSLENNDNLLLVEDVITTGGSVQKTLGAVFSKTGEDGVSFTLIPTVACLVDRRAEKGPLVLKVGQVDITVEVVSLMSISPRTWNTLEEAKKDCPNAVEAIKPKANWAKLVAG